MTSMSRPYTAIFVAKIHRDLSNMHKVMTLGANWTSCGVKGYITRQTQKHIVLYCHLKTFLLDCH